jgi:hypothetical protein
VEVGTAEGLQNRGQDLKNEHAETVGWRVRTTIGAILKIASTHVNIL